MSNYHTDKALDYVNKTRDILEDLPRFLNDYFRSVISTMEASSRYQFAVDFRNFLEFLHDHNTLLSKKAIRDITLNDLSHLEAVDIEEYLEFLLSYTDKNGIQRSNGESGLGRKLTSIRCIFQYYVEHKRLVYNPATTVKMPKRHKKDIIYMDQDEIIDFLEYIENFEQHMVSEKDHRLSYFRKTKYRDIAICTLILGTGIRLSECVGLNIDDVDFKNNGIIVTRKGGKMQRLYFSDEVRQALLNYIEIERQPIADVAVDAAPLFFSIQKKRISNRAVENMIKKYASEAVPLKPITTHKLRASFATSVVEKTGDIQLAADALGHESVTTTQRYANVSEKRRKQVANIVSLKR